MPPRSKMRQMPPAVREWIERALIEGQHGGYEQLAEAVKARGYEISKSALHREDQRLQRTMSAIKASTEAARQIAASLPDQTDELSQTLIRMVQAEMFDILVQLRESAAQGDLQGRLKALATAIKAASDSARASVTHRKWQDDAKAKLDAVEKTAEKQGRRLDGETLKAVREALYGG